MKHVRRFDLFLQILITHGWLVNLLSRVLHVASKTRIYKDCGLFCAACMRVCVCVRACVCVCIYKLSSCVCMYV